MACKIPLTNGLTAVVDDQDFDLVNQYRWYHVVDHKGVVHAARTERRQYMHQLILGLAGKYQGKVDHRNGDGLDNRRANLRLTSAAGNVLNSRLNNRNKSGFKGVHWDKRDRKWRATVTVNCKNYDLGSWETPKEAHAAYCLILGAYYEADYERDICPNNGQDHLPEQVLEALGAFKKIDKWRQRRRPQINSTSGYIGVSWDKRWQRWRAHAMINRKFYHLGHFDDVQTAARVRRVFLESMIGPDQLPKLQRILQ